MPASDFSLETVQTNLVKLAAELHPKVFFALYPHPFYFPRDPETGSIVVKLRPFGWKWVPWLCSTIAATIGVGFSSSGYVFVTSLLGMREKSLPIFKMLVMLAYLGVGSIEIFGSMFFMKYREALAGWNQLFVLERQCKYVSKIFLS